MASQTQRAGQRAAVQASRLQGFWNAAQELVANDSRHSHLKPFNDAATWPCCIACSLASSTTPQASATPPEHIRVESVAGTGAFAVVYRGRLDVSDMLVAVKAMPIDPGTNDMMLVRNATELAALSIQHHNVVQMLA